MKRGAEYQRKVQEAEAAHQSRRRNSMAERAVCAGCGRRGAGTRLRYRVLPHNWKLEKKLLCAPCSKREPGWFREESRHGWAA